MTASQQTARSAVSAYSYLPIAAMVPRSRHSAQRNFSVLGNFVILAACDRGTRHWDFVTILEGLSPVSRHREAYKLHSCFRMETQTATAGRETFPLASQAFTTLSPTCLAQSSKKWRRRESNSRRAYMMTSPCNDSRNNRPVWFHPGPAFYTRSGSVAAAGCRWGLAAYVEVAPG